MNFDTAALRPIREVGHKVHTRERLVVTYSVNAVQVDRMLGSWHSHGPAYVDLADSLSVLILDGRLPLGGRIPAERLLAPQLGVSRNTVTAAYRLLREQGYVRSLRGAGTFIVRPKQEQRVDRVVSWALGRGEDGAIDFTIASPAGPTDSLYEATRTVADDLTTLCDQSGYDLRGLPELRRAIAERYARMGVPTDPDEIMVTAGAQHAWSLLIKTITRQRDLVMIDSPTYPNAVDAIHSLNRRSLPVGLDAGGWNADLLRSVLYTKRPRLGYLMADFHNPTGLVMPPEVRAGLIEAAHHAGTFLAFDETLSDLALDDDGPVRATVPEMRSNVLLIGSLSKTFWAGLRVGWIRAPGDLIARVMSVRGAADAGNSILPQLVACRLLASYDAFLRERKRVLAENRAALVDSVRREMPSWRFAPPRGGLSLWIDLGTRASSRLALAAPRYGVRVLPGARFGGDGTLNNYLRLPFVHSGATARDGVRRLAQAFREVVHPG